MSLSCRDSSTTAELPLTPSSDESLPQLRYSRMHHVGTVALIDIHRLGCQEQHSKLVKTEKAKNAAERKVVKLRERVDALEAELMAINLEAEEMSRRKASLRGR